MSIIWMPDIYFLQIFSYTTVSVEMNKIIDFCMIVILPVINLGVSFMNIWHEYKIIKIYNEILEGVLKSQ